MQIIDSHYVKLKTYLKLLIALCMSRCRELSERSYLASNQLLDEFLFHRSPFLRYAFSCRKKRVFKQRLLPPPFALSARRS